MADRLVAGRYRLVARLGQGGMGVVWRAHDELLRRDVAIKELHVRLGFDADDEHGRRVLREARAAAGLRHPGVVAIHDVVVDGAVPLIVMELVEGPSLAQVLRAEGPLPEARVAMMGLRLLRALEAAHRRGIVHRDVKPANVLLDGDRVVLTDFGIAASAGETTQTEAGAVLGSPDYLAPERINGEPATAAADLWSLGVTLCAALRGASPFQRSDTQATLAAVLTYTPPPIPQAPRLWPVLKALLSKDPRDRPTASGAALMLAAIADPEAEPQDWHTERVLEPMTVPVTPTDRRSWRPLAALVGVLVLVAAAGVWLVVRGGGDVAGEPSAATTLPPAPPGFVTHQGHGFTIAVPADWRQEEEDAGEYALWPSSSDPRNSAVLIVESWDDRPYLPTARSVLSDYEDTDFSIKSITNYKRLRFDDRPAAGGTTVAELEVTYHVDEEFELDVHDMLHAVVTDDGQTVVITLATQNTDPAATEQMWQRNQQTFATILGSFQLAV
jgi:hypothetical protein